MEDKIIADCERCGEPKLASRSGKEVHLRCACDWKRGFFDRIRKTVHPDFWKGKDPKTMADWDPPIFQKDKAGRFDRFVRIQKAVAIQKLYGFCFRPIPGNRLPLFSIDHSIRNGLHLFIRGPSNSGRGLLMSSIKVFCAMKDISVTPLPGDFAIFKSELIESGLFSKEGVMARSAVSENYLNVDVLMLEGIRAERRTNLGGNKISVKFRGCDSVDNLVAKRMSAPGCMVFSSGEFVGEIGDSMGDKLFEELDSSRTQEIILFHPKEAEALLEALKGRQDFLWSVVDRFRIDKSEKKSRKTSGESAVERVDAENVKEAFYFEESFKNIPTASPDSAMRIGFRTHGSSKFSGEVMEIAQAFEKEKKDNSMAYQTGMDAAQTNAVRACRELASMMTDKEVRETASLLRLATASVKEHNLSIRSAIECRKRISGEEDDAVNGMG